MSADPQKDGWNYLSKPGEGDARKIVTLEEGGMVWVGIRAWHHDYGRWMNNGEPERATVIAWRDLAQPAKGHWERGILYIPFASEADALASRVLNGDPVPDESKFGFKP